HNTRAVVGSTEPDADTVGGPTAFSIVGGADMGLFQLAVDGHHLEFISPKDYETDAHTYHLTVRASDGANTSDQPITVTLTDVNDNAPVFTSSASMSVDENAAGRTAAATVV